jgi:hypothetical protein
MEDVTRAISQLIKQELIQVASTPCIDCEKVRMLTLTERLISETVGRRVMSAETRRKISEAARRRSNRGPVSDETKRKLSEVFRGRKFSEETRRKISEAQRQRHAARRAPIAV